MDPTVIVALIGAAGALATTALGLVQRQQVRAVHEQVRNTHSTNLREDLDRLIHGQDLLLEGQRRHEAEIAAIRADLRLERMERIALAARLDDDEE